MACFYSAALTCNPTAVDSPQDVLGIGVLPDLAGRSCAFDQ